MKQCLRKSVWLALLLTIIAAYCWLNLWAERRDDDAVNAGRICADHLRSCGRVLIRYAVAHNRLPLSVPITSPQWVQALRENKTTPSHILKCPSDRTSTVTSYALDPGVAGRSLEEIPRKKWRFVALVYELPFSGNHHHVCYLDGHVERAK